MRRENIMKKILRPLISVVTASYNHGKYIEENILSVLNQNYNNIEHIIIDAGSKDNTIEILKKYHHLKWTSEPDKGQSDGLNKGFLKAKGEWILWLNSDDILLPNAINSYCNALSNYPEHNMFYGHIEFIDAQGKKIRNVISVPFYYEYILHGIFMPPSTGTLFQSSLLKNNLLDIDYHYSMDTEWYLRCRHLIKSRLVNTLIISFRFWENKTANLFFGAGLCDQQVKEREMSYKKYIHPILSNGEYAIKLSFLKRLRVAVKFKYYFSKLYCYTAFFLKNVS